MGRKLSSELKTVILECLFDSFYFAMLKKIRKLSGGFADWKCGVKPGIPSVGVISAFSV